MLRLDQNEFVRDELIQVCREHCANNPIELKKIDEFERTYEPRNAIKWYTTDCFLYQLINRSLEIESINLIFKLRYFIRLLLLNQSILRLYRGLTMKLHELQETHQNKGNLISTNSFLLTTSDYEAALMFAGDGNIKHDDISVIYKIQVDTTVKHSIPFAKIYYISIFKNEDEVLFSMTAVFHVGETEQLKDHLWTIELTLTLTEDEQWNILTAHLAPK
jgi:hypothetical protein